MHRVTLALLFVACTGAVQAQSISCSSVPKTMPLRASVLAPVASELVSPSEQLGTAGGVLVRAYDETQSVDQVLLRMRVERCKNVAVAIPAPKVVDPLDPAAYQPRTQYDNAPWRFNMNQNGRNMTADEFSAWMTSRGVRVARGGAPAVTPPPVLVLPAAQGAGVPGAAGNTPPPPAPSTYPASAVLQRSTPGSAPAQVAPAAPGALAPAPAQVAPGALAPAPAPVAPSVNAPASPPVVPGALAPAPAPASPPPSVPQASPPPVPMSVPAPVPAPAPASMPIRP